ncbi:polysaccharide pyruvyl transferase family protein [Streptococcus pluranimalium]|uniref:polysaccharide pyruvyl transferase family protein n=1 Tax=Streptococcus pluranimalium TaxID=82348 RepID=UPI0031397E0E
MKMYVHGSFMNDNFGDFLLYDIVVDYLLKKHPNMEVFSKNVSKTYDQLQVVNRKTDKEILEIANLAILAGGGYFGQPGRPVLDHYWNYNFLKNHAFFLKKLADKKIPYIIIGVGVGPISWPIGKKLTKYIFENAQHIVVRDKESRDYCKDVLKISKAIDILPDLVMGCDIERYILDVPQTSEVNQDEKKIALHLTTKNRGNGEGIDCVLKDLIRYKNANKKDHFYLVCDQNSEKQRERANEIKNLLGNENVSIMEYIDPYHLCTLLSEMNIIITDKLHVGIVGTRLGKHVISVSSHVKIGRFYNQMGRENFSIRLKDLKDGDIFNLLNQFPWKLNNINNFILKSKESFNQIDYFVNKMK